MASLVGLLKAPNCGTDKTIWEKLCPELSIVATGDADEIDHKPPAAPAIHDAADDAGKDGDTTKDEDVVYNKRMQSIVQDGYCLVDDVPAPSLIEKIRNGIEQLVAMDLPPTLIFLFDETWELAKISSQTLTSANANDNQFNYDVLAWHIPHGSAGFSPHRDRQPDDVASSFHSDSQIPKFITHWIALSDATPSSSCLYMIPKSLDPGYMQGDVDSADPLQRALCDKHAYQHIRAMPRQAGQSVLFSHRIIHWGSHCHARTQPRIAISFVASHPDFEPSLLAQRCTMPSLQTRLVLICGQLLIYYQRFDFSKELIRACYEYCKLHQDILDETYRHKVFVEFIKAMKEHADAGVENVGATAKTDKATTVQLVINGDGKEGEDDDDDDEDAMMEEMLNAEEEGYGEFQDDFDEVENDDQGDDGKNEDGEDEDPELAGIQPFVFGDKKRKRDV
uniref:Uncharacterized protein n=1 Tax=Craspedostauros australis TaxID=1486917 RepID=A0A7R9WSB1_9STRA|mmetsp:Transcript_18438/g.51221  ORF Transcript_18438/g.51221 Transcript_18438/m.51221 type:complete len:450 (+) Transcript_18438:127-1476(+)|eukprot:CAMPEP_0198125528 /NCGR_PEP_ID=MMETSP1442-20131203/42776_1 /TAXON_ID= /ORGANISM="Craspedostauros australis, Strain CCMP3328" /LENGTH=449 /DNA_ID=CAMNT_0043785137 /DNA_START=60 /DNA_END=1409 /DNA_ORIENTATION=+